MKDAENNKSAFGKGGMFNEATPRLFELAKRLRQNMTGAEMVLWGHLKAGLHGLKFRRQHPLGIYIADFYCHKIKLVIEVDGSIHDKAEIKDYDAKRESDLIKDGYHVIRFKNDKVMKEVESVLAEISSIVEKLNNSSK